MPELDPSLTQIFKKGSKSFSLAARLLDREAYEAACRVYAWCRYCDDAVDSCADQGRDALNDAVEKLRAKTLSLYRGEEPAEPAFRAFREVAFRYGIPESQALELIEGMAMDARQERYETLGHLEVYAFRVAGVVGLMMARVLGAKDPRAAFCAEQLGIGMQLTNISRDILEDYSLGRVYLPLSWITEAGLTPQSIALPENRERLAALAGRLVREAERYYTDGEQGLRYLPRRPAFAIAAASSIYRAIGHKVVRRGARAWDSRTVVSLPAKTFAMLRSFRRVRALV